MCVSHIYKRFMGIENLEHVAAELSNWSKADSICRYVNKVREEAVDPEVLLKGEEPEVRALGEVYQAYQQILVEENAIDFSAIQSEMLSNDKRAAENAKAKLIRNAFCIAQCSK